MFLVLIETARTYNFANYTCFATCECLDDELICLQETRSFPCTTFESKRFKKIEMRGVANCNTHFDTLKLQMLKNLRAIHFDYHCNGIVSMGISLNCSDKWRWSTLASSIVKLRQQQWLHLKVGESCSSHVWCVGVTYSLSPFFISYHFDSRTINSTFDMNIGSCPDESFYYPVVVLQSFRIYGIAKQWYDRSDCDGVRHGFR